MISTKENSCHLGDCLDIMPHIPDKSINMILCDLPYGTTACKWDSIIPFDKLWEQYNRIIKDNGVIVLTAAEPFSSLLIVSNLKMFKYDWIWEKTHPKGHLNANKMPMRSHEQILIFYNKTPTYNPIKTKGHPRKVAKTSYFKPMDGNSVYGSEKRDTNYDSTERFPRSVQLFGNADLTNILHPTQKPVALFEYLIKTYTNEGDIVLDNTAGVFTTAIACLNTNRKYIVIEKEQGYFDKGTKRIEDWYKEKNKPSLFGY